MVKKAKPLLSIGLFILLVYIILQRFVVSIPMGVAIPVLIVGLALVVAGAIQTRRAPPPPPPSDDEPTGLL
ncbi:MAG: hypothetical protein GXY32_08595 [Ruminococcaceae bacterium]|nr:hypothetical protein [Oscillospiraceae bacterium]